MLPDEFIEFIKKCSDMELVALQNEASASFDKYLFREVMSELGRRASRKAVKMKMVIFAVCYSNYHPYEVDSLWLNEADANARADELEGDWRVYPMEVHESLPTHLPADGAYWICQNGHANHDVDTRFCWACDAPRR